MNANCVPVLYDRQPGESRQAFAAFATYRDLGPSRSLVKAGRELGKSLALLERWSARWRWVARAEAYDEFLDQLKRDRTTQLILEMCARHATLAQKLNNLTAEEIDRMTFDQLATLLKVAVSVETRARGEPD